MMALVGTGNGCLIGGVTWQRGVYVRVLLINPPLTAEQRYGKDLAQFGPCSEPLGLAYVAGALEQAGHEVEIYDGQTTILSIFSYAPVEYYDLIGITMNTPSYGVVKSLCQEIKDRPDTKHIPIVLGGPHPTVMPEETLKDIPETDYVVKGEDAIPFIFGINPASGMITGLGAENINLDTLPLPARHLLPMKQYQITASRNKGHHAYTVIVARGCPFNCAFCCRLHGRKVRFHSVDRVIQEIELLVRDYDAKEINLEADTITVNRKWVYSLCDALISTRLNTRVSWTCESRVDTVDEAMLRYMKQAGCWQVSYGVESGSQRLLDFIKKGITLEQVRETFRITKKVGINIRAFFMLGIPTESREESNATVAFSKALKANWSQFTICTPFPGTALYSWCLEHEPGRISRNWSDFRTHGGWTATDLAYTPQGRTEAEMKALQKQAYRSVYLRPGRVWSYLAKVRSLRQLWQGFKGAWIVAKTRWA
jgi:anaerobic magnesium-protoporphyrin IX monomethyl ester cyclase